MGRKLREAAMLGALLGMGGVEMQAQQKQAQKTEQKASEGKQETREKYDKMRDVGDEAKKFDDVERQKYKQYLQMKKGSQEEKDLFLELHYNHTDLEGRMAQLLEYSTDQDSAIADKAMSIWSAINKNIEIRRKDCANSGKDYFDRTPSPNNPKPPKD